MRLTGAVCCKSCNETPKECKSEEDEWAKQDTECVLAGGRCIFEGNQCNNFIKPELGCGGPDDRQCCAPNVSFVILTLAGK
jgi:hypothetical protein